jgi:hypothetical protein
MILLGGDVQRHIEETFRGNPQAFPRGGALDYPQVVAGWIAHFESNVLPYVTAGGISADGAGHLTMHDKEHIRRVRAVANSLIKDTTGEITPYELTLLLCAIYLHDVGNIFGRAGHERRIGDVLRVAGAPHGFDRIESRTAEVIAGVHGGKIDGSKDTISTLDPEARVHGQVVRARMLAALLRLADELADDPARANRIQLASNTIVKEAEVYHHFAAALHTQLPHAARRTVELHFDFFDYCLFQRPLGKGDGEVYLLDEIFIRSVKAFHEARYCSRFLRPLLDFDRVTVDIKIFDDEDGSVLKSVTYTLAETGYGDETKDIYSLAPELEVFEGNGRLTPEHFSNLLTEAVAAHRGQTPCNPTGPSDDSGPASE